MKKKFDSMEYWKVGLLQALGILGYITLFAFLMSYISNLRLYENNVLGPIFLITSFVVSACITGSIGVLYPAYLFLYNKPRRGFEIFASMVGFLVLFGLFVLLCGVLLFVV